VRTGVVAELNGKFWGIEYEDGHSTSYAFGPIEKAKMSDPQFCTKPEDMTYGDSPYLRELRMARLVKVTMTTVYAVEC
jgi:hypothetical protein